MLHCVHLKKKLRSLITSLYPSIISARSSAVTPSISSSSRDSKGSAFFFEIQLSFGLSKYQSVHVFSPLAQTFDLGKCFAQYAPSFHKGLRESHHYHSRLAVQQKPGVDTVMDTLSI